jgi:hypothetical protein
MDLSKGLDWIVTHVAFSLSSLLGWRVVLWIVGDSNSPVVVDAVGITASLTRNDAFVFDDVDIRQKRRCGDSESVVWVVPGNANLAVQSMVVVKVRDATRII